MDGLLFGGLPGLALKQKGSNHKQHSLAIKKCETTESTRKCEMTESTMKCETSESTQKCETSELILKNVKIEKECPCHAKKKSSSIL